MIEKLGFKETKLVKNKSIFSLVYGGNKQCKLIYDWLYKDCDDLYLVRKKEKFENIQIFEPNTNNCLFCNKKAVAKELCQNHYMTYIYYKNKENYNIDEFKQFFKNLKLC